MIRLKELFDTEPQFIRTSKEDDSNTDSAYVVYFKMMNKRGYMMDYKVVFYEYRLSHFTDDPEDYSYKNFYEVQFLSKLEKENSSGWSIEVLGDMQAFKIFSSVWKIIDSSLKKLNAIGFEMGADKDEVSRLSLYKKFAEMIDKHSIWKLYKQHDREVYDEFVFLKKDEFEKRKSSTENPLTESSTHNLAKSLEDELNKKYPSDDKKGFVIELWPASYRKDFAELVVLYIPKEHRNKGIGSEIMNWITKYADENHMIVGATPSTDFGATSVNRIRTFNKRFGFVRNTGRNVDYTISNTMYRKPKTA
jgi:hypothetical protein